MITLARHLLTRWKEVKDPLLTDRTVISTTAPVQSMKSTNRETVRQIGNRVNHQSPRSNSTDAPSDPGIDRW